MISTYGGRKFILSMTVILLSTFLVWFGKIDAEVFKYLVLVTAGAYIAGNVTQKATLKEGATNGSTNQVKL